MGKGCIGVHISQGSPEEQLQEIHIPYASYIICRYGYRLLSITYILRETYFKDLSYGIMGAGKGETWKAGRQAR